MTKKLYEVSGVTSHDEWFVAFCVFDNMDSIIGYFKALNMYVQNIIELKQVKKDTTGGIIDIKRFDRESLLNLLL